MDSVEPDGVWAGLVGQDRVVATLRRAVAGGRHAMSHAWLFTGPPGSGRSNAARAFAAALQCPDGGCGQCNACLTALSGAHPDVTIARIETLSIKVDDVVELVRHAAMFPAMGRYQVVVIEDADRVTERAADMLLKSIEEPAQRTVWILCAPTPDDVVVTIRSRCRQVALTTPSEQAIAWLLSHRDGVEPDAAAFAARVSQGHIGRARALATNEDARARRAAVLSLPSQLTSLGSCLEAAQRAVEAATAEAEAVTAELDQRETVELARAVGFGQPGARRGAAAAMRDLEDEQKARAKRLQRDSLDRLLTEFTAFYRDVLAVQVAPGVRLVNEDVGGSVTRLAKATTPEATVAKLDAILACRQALETNVAPLLAMEALMIALRSG